VTAFVQGLSTEGACPTKKCTFKLYFPKPPYHGVDYHAARTKDGFNFVVFSPSTAVLRSDTLECGIIGNKIECGFVFKEATIC
jgi:hypothetical protein